MSKFLKSRAAYLAVIVIGFGVDFGITLALARLAEVALPVAAVAGFLTALVLNYLLFEFWAFRSEGSGFSLARFAKTAASAAVAISVRLMVISSLGLLVSDSLFEDVFRVGAGAAVSLVVNFMLVSRVFRPRQA